jgi:hypothetical protein
MKLTAVRVGSCWATIILLATGCDSTPTAPRYDSGGLDGAPLRLDTAVGSEVRDVASGGDQRDLPPTVGPDARDVATTGEVPGLSETGVPPGSDGPGIAVDGPSGLVDAPIAGVDGAAGIEVPAAIDAPALPRPLDGGLACGPAGASCASAADCCGLACAGGFCTASACLSDGVSCGTGGQCCSTVCGASGTCVPLNPRCKTAGNACTTASECCNGVCNDLHQCAPPGEISYCAQAGDICRADAECCTGVCNVAAGALAGTCATISTACTIDGTVCDGCGACCSHFCGPFGVGGPKICQPASGCHVQGDLCHKDSDCCGGDVTSGLPGAGLIKCELDSASGGRIGTCGGPSASNCPGNYATCKSSCNPEGNICHYTNTAVCEGATTSKRNDCCGCINSKECCQLDATGIPRCNTLAACVPVGGNCAFSGECCNHEPCLPDPITGKLTCGAACGSLGGICTTNADCCTGMLCQVTPGSLGGTCIIPPPPTTPDAGAPVADGAADGELPPVDDAAVIPDTAPPPVCAYFGQACSVDIPCCGGTSCVSSTFYDCTAADTDCVCWIGE